MKRLTNDQKIDHLIKVMRSCTNLTQLGSCENWLARVTFDGGLFESWRITEALCNEYADIRFKLISKGESNEKGFN